MNTFKIAGRTRIVLGAHARVAVSRGYDLIPAVNWELGDFSLTPLQRAYDHLAKDPYSGGSRERAYVRLLWNRTQGSIERSTGANTYEQPLAFNGADGGKVRRFVPIPDELLLDPLVKGLIYRDLWIAEATGEFAGDDLVQVELHAIRYRARPGRPAWSSPPWLHRDNEILVGVHLIHRDEHLVGGDNVLAGSTDSAEGDYTDVIPLLKPLDGLLLARHAPHAVTPMGVAAGALEACRDVLLVTFKHAGDNE